MTRFVYYSDVLAANRAEADAEAIRWAKQDAQEAARRAAFAVPDNMHPGIGVLTGAKGVRFYAHIGPKRIYTEGTVEQLTASLTS